MKLGPPGLWQSQEREWEGSSIRRRFQNGGLAFWVEWDEHTGRSLDLPRGRPLVARRKVISVEWLSWKSNWRGWSSWKEWRHKQGVPEVGWVQGKLLSDRRGQNRLGCQREWLHVLGRSQIVPVPCQCRSEGGRRHFLWWILFSHWVWGGSSAVSGRGGSLHLVCVSV